MFARLSLKEWFTGKEIFRGYVQKLLKLIGGHNSERVKEVPGATLTFAIRDFI